MWALFYILTSDNESDNFHVLGILEADPSPSLAWNKDTFHKTINIWVFIYALLNELFH